MQYSFLLCVVKNMWLMSRRIKKYFISGCCWHYFVYSKLKSNFLVSRQSVRNVSGKKLCTECPGAGGPVSASRELESKWHIKSSNGRVSGRWLLQQRYEKQWKFCRKCIFQKEWRWSLHLNLILTRVRLDYVTILNRIFKLNFKF